jgi:hypothetical protein
MAVIAIVVHEFVLRRGTHRSCKNCTLESQNRKSVDERGGLRPNRSLQKETRRLGRVFHTEPPIASVSLKIAIAEGATVAHGGRLANSAAGAQMGAPT